MAERIIDALVNAESAVILALWLAAVAFLFIGYWIGGRAWSEKFAVRMTGWADGRTISGKWTELAVITYTAILVGLINQLTPDAGLLRVVSANWPIVAGIVIGLVALVYVHSYRVVANLPGAEISYPDYARDVARGYAVYNLFSIIIFGFFLITGLLVVQQFIADQAEFTRHRATLDEALNQLIATSREGKAAAGSILSMLERVNSLLTGSVQSIIEQINTVFLVFFFVLAINFLIEFTPVRSAYSNEGVSATHSGVALVLVLVLLVGWYLYYSEYLGLMRGSIARVMEIESRMLTDDWELARRYYQILNDLRGRQGITGFALTLSNERGGLLLLLGALQFMFTQRQSYARNGTGSDASG